MAAKKPRLVLKTAQEEIAEPSPHSASLRRQGLSFAEIAHGEFPTLGSNTGMNNPNAANMWSGSRNLPGQMSRNQTPLQTPQPTQEDSYMSASRLGAQGTFRFGNMQQPQPQPSQANAADEFPPLNKNSRGEMGQERGPSMLPLGFNSQPGVDSRPGSGAPVQNGLGSKVHPIGRASGIIGAPGSSRGQAAISSDLESRQKLGSRDEMQSLPSADSDGPAQGSNPLGAIGNDLPTTRVRRDDQDRTPEAVDPLAGMSESDKWGLKGLRALMSNYPDFNAMMTGIDPAELGLDLSTTELISSQQWSVFESDPPRPVVTRFRLPECYRVNNVAPLQNKISSFADDTLFYIFYSCTRDLRQQWAAQELFGRNWRWNRKMSIWLTKDGHASFQNSGAHERGIYIVWDPKLWRREQRELVVCYADLESAIKPAA